MIIDIMILIINIIVNILILISIITLRVQLRVEQNRREDSYLTFVNRTGSCSLALPVLLLPNTIRFCSHA